MNKKEYNGWYNYETWLIKLWMDNDQGSDEYWRECARLCMDQAQPSVMPAFTKAEYATIKLAEDIKERHEESIEGVLTESSGFVVDLLNAAMSEVNWHEIAKHYIDELEQE